VYSLQSRVSTTAKVANNFSSEITVVTLCNTNEVTPVLQHHAMKTHRKNGDKAPWILNLGTWQIIWSDSPSSCFAHDAHWIRDLWVPERVWKWWQREKFCPATYRNQHRPVHNQSL